MKKQQNTPTKTTKRLELDVDVIADLEATDRETEAVRGGGRRTTGCRAATDAG